MKVVYAVTCGAYSWWSDGACMVRKGFARPIGASGRGKIASGTVAPTAWITKRGKRVPEHLIVDRRMGPILRRAKRLDAVVLPTPRQEVHALAVRCWTAAGECFAIVMPATAHGGQFIYLRDALAGEGA